MEREFLREEFERLIALGYPEGLDPREKMEMRRIFMSGAAAFLITMVESQESEFKANLTKLDMELKRFARLVMNGVA